MERRLHTRHRARTTVYVVMSGRKRRICKAKNLSASGVFVETENLGLRKGQQVQLAFAINLGLVTKIHRRTAIVAHVTRGGTGLMMEQLAGRKPRSVPLRRFPVNLAECPPSIRPARMQSASVAPARTISRVWIS